MNALSLTPCWKFINCDSIRINSTVSLYSLVNQLQNILTGQRSKGIVDLRVSIDPNGKYLDIDGYRLESQAECVERLKGMLEMWQLNCEPAAAILQIQTAITANENSGQK